MSKATARRLVVDCSVMRATGGPESRHPVGTSCRSFLEAIREHGHRLVITDAIVAEWNRYRKLRLFSRFALQWQTEMTNKNRVDRLDVPLDKPLHDAVAETTSDPHVIVAMDKDMHLVEAALASDRLVSSLDDRVRKYFAKAADQVPKMGVVVWVNPSIPAEECLDWLKRGAKSDSKRQLKNHGRSSLDRPGKRRAT